MQQYLRRARLDGFLAGLTVGGVANALGFFWDRPWVRVGVERDGRGAYATWGWRKMPRSLRIERLAGATFADEEEADRAMLDPRAVEWWMAPFFAFVELTPEWPWQKVSERFKERTAEIEKLEEREKRARGTNE